MKQMTITVGERETTLPIGSTAKDALAKLDIGPSYGEYRENPYVGVLINHELQSFDTVLHCNSVLEPVPLFGPMGKRMYRHSICYLLCCAVSMLYPDRHLVIGHSLGDGYYFNFDDLLTLQASDVKTIASAMKTLVGENLPIEQIALSYEEALTYLRDNHFDQTVSLLETRNDPIVEFYRLQGYMDISYEPLVDHTGLLSVWELRPYGERGMLLRYPRTKDFTKLQDFADNPQLFSIFREYKTWGNILHVRSLGQLNHLGNENTIESFIRLAEALQQRKIATVGDRICESGAIKAVFIAGPSSSGKTTFAHKLCTQLQVLGKKTIRISLDNYYLQPEMAPKDQDGKPNLEALEALDLPRFNDDLIALCDGKPVRLPRYDFKTLSRTYEEEAVTMDNRTILIIEGIHGMNPSLVEHIDKDTVFRVYISALTQINIDDHNRISTTDNRIIRRLVRDNRTRGTDAESTLGMWPSVHRGEDTYIFPYQDNADIMVNSALDYELGVLAPFAQPLLKMVKPSAGPAYETARRLLRFLDNINPIPATLVPETSLLREFIGGSEFDVV